jgi:hypothetical protein
MVFTDGVKYLADTAEAYWLIDAIASYQSDARLTKHPMLKYMQFWKLEVKDGKGILTCVADTGRKPAITQEIEFTDFPLPGVEVWVEYGGYETDRGMVAGMVAMLRSER